MADTVTNIEAARTVRGIPPQQYLVPFASVPALLRERAQATPAKEFLIYYDAEGRREALSYAAFEARVRRIAHQMGAALGIRRGDRIATVAYNHPETVATYFAAWSLGAVVVPINVSEDDPRITYILENAGVEVAFVRSEYRERIEALRPGVSRLREIVGMGHGARGAGRGADTSRTRDPRPAPRDWTLEKLEAAGDPGFVPAEAPTLEDECLLVYTSGTTGPPKGVVLIQYNLLVDAKGVADWQQIGAEQRMMCVLPIHHVNGILVTLVTPLYTGGSVVLQRQFRASTFWEHLAREGVHVVSVVPTLLQFLCEAAEGDAQRSTLDARRGRTTPDPLLPEPSVERRASSAALLHFRHFVCGAGTLSVALATRFEEQFGLRILHGYGLSETTCYSCFLPLEIDAEEHRRWMRDWGYPSIGVPIDPNEMAIMDPEGRLLAAGARGEIIIRGHNVMKHYFQRPDANETAFQYGWFHSGDEGFFQPDAQGRPYFFITGRLKELINRGGVKFSPFEIEEAMLRLPGVRVALAVAFDNTYYGEEVGAYVVPQEGATLTEEAVLAHCRACMPFAKCPKVVVFGTEVPVTTTGKYQRLRLKDLFRQWESTQFRER
jgi:long-chain acyl-CoA synthetase